MMPGRSKKEQALSDLMLETSTIRRLAEGFFFGSPIDIESTEQLHEAIGRTIETLKESLK